jgi:hypothetical protein
MPASSLSEFANLQLQNYACNSSHMTNQKKQPLFAIPKLLVKPAFTPDEENKKITIDLTAALIPEKERKEMTKIEKTMMEVEHFIPQFVDCNDSVEKSHSKTVGLDQCCKRVTLSELKQSCNSVHSPKFSIIGKIIGKKYREKVPYIKHLYAKHTINRFSFDTPSPDDKILAHLSKKK